MFGALGMVMMFVGMLVAGAVFSTLGGLLGAGGEILGSKPASDNPRAWVATQGPALVSEPTVVNGEVIVAGDDGLAPLR